MSDIDHLLVFVFCDCIRITVYDIVVKMAKPERVVTTFRIDKTLLDGLKKVQEQDGVLVSEQVRRAIATWLESKGIKTERQGAGARKR
jgi:hypothetical protein